MSLIVLMSYSERLTLNLATRHSFVVRSSSLKKKRKHNTKYLRTTGPSYTHNSSYLKHNNNHNKHTNKHTNKTYLRSRSADPYRIEDGVSKQPLEHISLAVYLARVDLVEERHHDERVEDDREVLRGFGAQRLPAP